MMASTLSLGATEKSLFVILLLVGVSGGLLAFPASYFSNTNVLIGLCLLPLTLIISGTQHNNLFYVGLMVLFAALAGVYHVRIFYFFCLAFYFLWLVERFVGRLNVLVLFLVVFMSPFFIQVVTILGFPIRLMLSAFSGGVLNFVGLNVRVEGNMMFLDGARFTVDEACMGLNLLVISLLMGVFVLGFRYRISRTALGLYPTVIYFLIVCILNMITNVIRIVVLVLFRVPPENVMHDFIGILCLIVYVLVPLHFFGGWLARKYGKTKGDAGVSRPFSRRHIFAFSVISMAILFAGTMVGKKRATDGVGHADVSFGEVIPEKLEGGISKITTDKLLIYVKTIPEFFTGEHTPLMCWKGSGYEFEGVAAVTVDGYQIYKGTLVNEDEPLYTAWWYSNGKVETISQLDWRMRMLRGDPKFYLVNVTAADEQTLMAAISSILTTDALAIKTH